MNTVWAHHTEPQAFAAICGFVAKRVWGKLNDFGAGTAMGVVHEGQPVAGVVFHNWDADAGVIELTAAADTPRWLNRAVLADMFGYAFGQLGCQAVVLRVDPENRRMDRIARAYGFVRHDIPRLRGKNKAEAVYVLSDDAWRANGFHRS